jgi:hypothetical protein
MAFGNWFWHCNQAAVYYLSWWSKVCTLPWLEKESMDTPQKGMASFKSFKFLFICSFFPFFLEAWSG